MKLKFESIINDEEIKSKITEMKKKIELIENTDFNKEYEITSENITKLKRIRKAYQDVILNDWDTKPLKIILANSDGTKLANIN